jgi:hypothetical protein
MFMPAVFYMILTKREQDNKAWNSPIKPKEAGMVNHCRGHN